ncbi:Uma2 family endonuclease [Pseudanabaena sp. FACHB-1998]|uniref:Uma2 family endonuclease n=1 Tax=Pseudanabaena sp. FACHB-1998 TaxID=2692858 RepID=UPI0016813C6F|nr:Uma2 family endonuclease [Pseudanabaena sp. FACHB-1998]MBD2177217.1 Uma2 family endonuclease [Pseudanabaena sp. FACHB-1998]
MTVTLSKSSDRTSNQILLPSIRWETYRAIACDLESQPNKRLTYDQGLLEIRMPSELHESYKKLLGRIVEALTESLGLEICSLGSMTCDREDLARGLEPDQCYYIQNEAEIWGKNKIDLISDPPPDLAIEIDITNSSLNRFAIYAQLGVPEVWRYDGQTITIHQLNGDRYLLSDRSVAFPIIGTDDLQNFLELKHQVKENALIRQLREWVTLRQR